MAETIPVLPSAAGHETRAVINYLVLLRPSQILSWRWDGTNLNLRFLAPYGVPWVQVQVQNTGAGNGGLTYDPVHFVSSTRVDCRSNRQQDVQIAAPSTTLEYAVFLVPVMLDAAGTYVLYDGQGGRPDNISSFTDARPLALSMYGGNLAWSQLPTGTGTWTATQGTFSGIWNVSGASTISGLLTASAGLTVSGGSFLVGSSAPGAMTAGIAYVLNNTGQYSTFDSAGSGRVLIYMDNANPDVVHVRNNQRNAGGTISFETIAGGATTSWQMTSAGHLLAGTDNSYDIGASGATRPRNLYLAGAATVAGTGTFSGLLTASGGFKVPGGITIDETNQSDLVRAGAVNANEQARVQFYPHTSGAPWEIDNAAGTLRIYQPANIIVQLSSPSGGTGNFVLGTDPGGSEVIRANGGGLVVSNSSSTATIASRLINAGQTVYFGIDNSAGNGFAAGQSGTAYAAAISSSNGISLVAGSSLRVLIKSTGEMNLVNGPISMGSNQVVTTRQTGWTNATATPSRSAIANGATLSQVTQGLAALINDLFTHGLIGT